MTYTSYEKSMSEDDFHAMIATMYQRCGMKLPSGQFKRWYQDFGTYPREILISACRRIGENDTKFIKWRTIKDAIDDVTPDREETGKVGCAYCDTLGCIDYWKEINNVNYQYSARCHKCKTSRYINLPYYNDVFPDDDIKPHSTPEQMVCGDHIMEDVVRVMTGRQHADAAQERKRERQLYREKTL